MDTNGLLYWKVSVEKTNSAGNSAGKRGFWHHFTQEKNTKFPAETESEFPMDTL